MKFTNPGGTIKIDIQIVDLQQISDEEEQFIISSHNVEFFINA